jgi:hypothetical protein
MRTRRRTARRPWRIPGLPGFPGPPVGVHWVRVLVRLARVLVRWVRVHRVRAHRVRHNQGRPRVDRLCRPGRSPGRHRSPGRAGAGRSGLGYRARGAASWGRRNAWSRPVARCPATACCHAAAWPRGATRVDRVCALLGMARARGVARAGVVPPGAVRGRAAAWVRAAWLRAAAWPGRLSAPHEVACDHAVA